METHVVDVCRSIKSSLPRPADDSITSQLLAAAKGMKPEQKNNANVCAWILSQMNRWRPDVAEDFSIEISNFVYKYQQMNRRLQQRDLEAQQQQQQQQNVRAPQPQPHQQAQQHSQVPSFQPGFHGEHVQVSPEAVQNALRVLQALGQSQGGAGILQPHHQPIVAQGPHTAPYVSTAVATSADTLMPSYSQQLQPSTGTPTAGVGHVTTAGNIMATPSPSYTQLLPASGSTGAGIIQMAQSAINRSRHSGSSISSGSPSLQSLLNMALPYGTDVNIPTPEHAMSPLLCDVSVGEEQQAVHGLLRAQGDEVNTPRIGRSRLLQGQADDVHTPRIGKGNTGGDDGDPPDDGNEGQ